MQRQSKVFNVGPTLYNVFTNVLCLQGNACLALVLTDAPPPFHVEQNIPNSPVIEGQNHTKFQQNYFKRFFSLFGFVSICTCLSKKVYRNFC